MLLRGLLVHHQVFMVTSALYSASRAALTFLGIERRDFNEISID